MFIIKNFFVIFIFMKFYFYQKRKNYFVDVRIFGKLDGGQIHTR